jgi:hypothetical protein
MDIRKLAVLRFKPELWDPVLELVPFSKAELVFRQELGKWCFKDMFSREERERSVFSDFGGMPDLEDPRFASPMGTLRTVYPPKSLFGIVGVYDMSNDDHKVQYMEARDLLWKKHRVPFEQKQPENPKALGDIGEIAQRFLAGWPNAPKQQVITEGDLSYVCLEDEELMIFLGMYYTGDFNFIVGPIMIVMEGMFLRLCTTWSSFPTYFLMDYNLVSCLAEDGIQDVHEGMVAELESTLEKYPKHRAHCREILMYDYGKHWHEPPVLPSWMKS